MTRTLRMAAAAAAAIVAALLACTSAFADLSISDAGLTMATPSGDVVRQAGAHPDITTNISFGTTVTPDGTATTDGSVRDVHVDLPPGVVGNPTVVPTCDDNDLVPPGGSASIVRCPVASQVGFVRVYSRFPPTGVPSVVGALYNMRRDDNQAAVFGFNYAGVAVKIIGRVRPTDYGVSVDSTAITQTYGVFSLNVSFWGVPGDPSHNPDRYDPSTFSFGASSPVTPKPFLSNATSCPDAPQAFTIQADSWQTPGAFTSKQLLADPDGVPYLTQGCSRLQFAPSATVQALSRSADAPTGLDFDLRVPQSDAPEGLATAQVRKVAVTLPRGMSVSPSAAAGLGACSLAAVRLGSDADADCPSSSKIGTVDVTSPLVDHVLHGDVVLAAQGDNPFGSLLAMYIIVPGPGFELKLAARIDADPVTGQLTTTFDNNPQLPFSELHLKLNGGSQAPLATPPSCGTYSAHTEATSWASSTPVTIDSPIIVDAGCDLSAAPSVTAGADNPAAGQDTSFTLTATRRDNGRYLSSIRAVLPPGLLARIGDVPVCAAAAASVGTCPAQTRIGGTTVLAGPGAQPLPMVGDVYLTGPHAGAPFGLSVVVRTAGQAGPYDLGTVVVQAGIAVDSDDGHVTVTSDHLPTIIQGIPLRLRQVKIAIDRPAFMFNPTSCRTAAVGIAIDGTDGSSWSSTVPFGTAGCAALPFNPKLLLAMSGKGQTTDGKHPALTARLTTPSVNDARIRRVQVNLPLSLALDPDNANGLCEPADAAADRCPAKSIVGNATAYSVLHQPLRGPVYFVRGERTDPRSKRVIKTLPKLFVPLVGDGVKINLRASSEVVSNHLVTTFDDVPDAPVTQFDLNIAGGRHGILVVSGTDICKSTQRANARLAAQNGAVRDASIVMTTPSCLLRVISAKRSGTRLKVLVGGLAPARVSVSAGGIASVTRNISSATAATFTARLSTVTLRRLTHGHDVRLRMSLRMTPKGSKRSRTVHQVVKVRGTR